MTSAPCSRACRARARIFSALAVISPTKKCDCANAKVTLSCDLEPVLASFDELKLGLSVSLVVSFDIVIVPINRLCKCIESSWVLNKTKAK